jgi:hypothetical protein
MPNFDNALRTLEGTPSRVQAGKPAAGVFVILVLACLGLTACGSSSGSSTAANAAGSATSASGTSTQGGSTTGSSTTGGPSTASPATGSGRQRFSAIRECLQKNGVTFPQRTSGSGSPAGARAFPGAGGGPVLPKGMTRSQFEAASKKCGGSNFGARGGRPGGPGFRGVSSPAFKQALTKYAECLRQNGINLPAPNTSGKGPVFSTKGIDTASPQFRAATMKCRASLVSALRRPQGTGAAGTTTAPSGGERSR